MLTLLIVANLVIPIVYVMGTSVRNGRISVNHEMLFGAGFLFYWIAPVLIGLGDFFQDDPTMTIWYSIFHYIDDEKIVIYFLLCLCFYGFFCLGNIAARAFVPEAEKIPPIVEPELNGSLLNVYLAAALFMAGILIFVLRDEFFRGYRTENEEIASAFNWSARGTFAACNLFLLDLAIIYGTYRHLTAGLNRSFADLFLNKYTLAYAAVSLIFLSAGGRLYFVTGILAFVVYRSVYFQALKLRTFLLGLAAAIVAIGAIGVFRLQDEISWESGNINIWQESLNTAFPLVAFLRDISTSDLLAPVRFPVVLLGDFANLIPLMLFPDKANLLINPEDMGFTIYNPAGALNSFVSCIFNFGIYGTMVFLFLVGFGLQWLRRRGQGILARSVYVMSSAAVGATFFRDPFSISLIKGMLQFSILIPVCIVLSMRWIPSFTAEPADD
jgi:hypothetical protein